jgi:Bacteriophage HK97-gp10, putative tail-component
VTPNEFERRLKRDLKHLKSKASDAVERAARKAVRVVAKNTPKAFGELRDSIHAEGKSTIIDAPHAQAVEVGARPHLVPLEELIKWVKLRGMQGLTPKASGKGAGGRTAITGRKSGWDGPTSREHAIRVASELRALEHNGSLDINAPEQIAKRIQMGILHNGIKPTWFVLKSLPDVMNVVDAELRKVFK